MSCEIRPQKHIFIVNPFAGPQSSVERIRETIAERKAKTGEDLEIYETKCQKDATAFVKRYLAEHPDGITRFYACGGDGTLNEVVNGAAGCENAEVACYPCGSGNDFVKVFGGKEVFLDLENLMEGTAVPLDVMESAGHYALNATHFGFDTAVARTMIKIKYKKFIGGKRAYTTGVLKALFTSLRNRCKVTVDGEELGEGYMTLCTLANGQYVGGSFRCAPRSHPDDGLLECCYVRPVTIFGVAKLISAYTKGDHLNDPRFAKLVVYKRGREIHVEAPKGFAFSLDGEIVEENDFYTRVCPGAIRFVLPKGAAFIGTK